MKMLKTERRKDLKILIGTPIHEVKDYCMEQWLENVSKLLAKYPADFLMVDNSHGLEYLKKVKRYCAKYGIKRCQIKHLKENPQLGMYERIEAAQEIIRLEVIRGNYDAWFSWECDQLIPINALREMTRLMKVGQFTMVNCNSWHRKVPNDINTDLGCALVKKEGLIKNSFLKYNEPWFKRRIVDNGGNFIDVFGIVTPIYHIDG